jgi:hypothetical protein
MKEPMQKDFVPLGLKPSQKRAERRSTGKGGFPVVIRHDEQGRFGPRGARHLEGKLDLALERRRDVVNGDVDPQALPLLRFLCRPRIREVG